jgi:NodT family efflux transporter outer membrane factor (OMF) lipoprotein
MKIISRLSRLGSVMAALALISGCAAGPYFQRPAAPTINGYIPEPLAKTSSANLVGGESQSYVEGMDISNQWWEVFKSPQLNALIQQSLKNNPDMQAAEAALRAAQEQVKAQQGAYYPTVTAEPSVSRQKVANSISSPLSSGSTIFSLNTAQVAVSYTPDVFGLNKREVESLQAQAEYQRFQVAAAYVTLTSNVVAAAVQEASLRAQIAATQDIIHVNTEMLDILQKQYSHGYVMRADVAAQEAQLAQVKTILPPLQKQLAQERNLLTALAGRYSSQEVAEKFELSDLHLPQQLPLSLPSRLIEQRPDVRSAEEQLHAASAQIGIATANRLPQFNIGALGGYTASSIAHLFQPADAFWSLTSGITAPIFDGGTLFHRQKSAEAVYDQAAAQYKSTVISAVQNVADTLRAIQYDADGLKAALDAEHATKVSFDVVNGQYKAGYITYAALLQAEQAYQQTKINLVQAQASRFADTAALFQALGGGWWNQTHNAGAVDKSPTPLTPSKG